MDQTSTNKSVIFVDFDNVVSALWDRNPDAANSFMTKPHIWLERLKTICLATLPRRWLSIRCYLNPHGFVPTGGERSERRYFSNYRIALVQAGFEVIDCPALTRQAKNAADIRIAIDALDLLAHPSFIEEFVIVSGDADFTPLLQRIRTEDRRITIVSPQHIASAYAAIADRVMDFDAMLPLLDMQQAVESCARDQLDDTAGDNISERERFETFVRNEYTSAAAALNMSTLASKVTERIPNAKTSNWFGYGGFGLALDALKLSGMKRSQHFIWDVNNHADPVSQRHDTE